MKDGMQPERAEISNVLQKRLTRVGLKCFQLQVRCLMKNPGIFCGGSIQGCRAPVILPFSTVPGMVALW